MIKIFIILMALTAVSSAALITGYEYGILPTNDDLFMTEANDYAFSMAMLGLVSAFAFWLGFNNHT